MIEQGLTRRVKRFLLLVVVPAVMLGVNVPPAWAWISELRHQQLINSQEYKEQFGKWDVVDLPDDQKVNAIHAAVLPTGTHPPHRRFRQQGGHVQRGDLQEPRLRPRDGT